MSSLGSYLKREREHRQISVAELAQTTRIPVRILHQLETDEIASLPADVFVRGFLRAFQRRRASNSMIISTSSPTHPLSMP